jgi:hypothetical protein
MKQDEKRQRVVKEIKWVTVYRQAAEDTLRGFQLLIFRVSQLKRSHKRTRHLAQSCLFIIVCG